MAWVVFVAAIGLGLTFDLLPRFSRWPEPLHLVAHAVLFGGTAFLLGGWNRGIAAALGLGLGALIEFGQMFREGIWMNEAGFDMVVNSVAVGLGLLACRPVDPRWLWVAFVSTAVGWTALITASIRLGWVFLVAGALLMGWTRPRLLVGALLVQGLLGSVIWALG